jgi:predicted transcriptional regulator
MKLTEDSETLAENKVLILYILNKLDKPINNESLLKLVLSIQEMNYFYFQQFLLDLLENKYIIGYTKEDKTMYKITDAGRETLSLTDDLLPGIMKLKIDNALKVEVNEVQNLNHVVSEFIPRNENEFIVKCKLIQNNITVFELNLQANSREEAKYIAEKWEKEHDEIYPIILELLTKK